MLKLLIADSGESFRFALAEQTRGLYRTRLCREGKETLEMILSFKPDLLVLDMMLPGLDGISILQEAADAGIRPVVLAITKYSSDYMVAQAQRLDVKYMMVKPCDIGPTMARLADLAAQLDSCTRVCTDPRTAVSNLLLNLGFATKLRGYSYLREAILEAVRCPGQMVTKELYPKVGKLCDANAIQVERSIRSSIAKAWAQRDEAMWSLYFRPDAGGNLKRPSNAAFISCIAERIGMEQS